MQCLEDCTKSMQFNIGRPAQVFEVLPHHNFDIHIDYFGDIVVEVNEYKDTQWDLIDAGFRSNFNIDLFFTVDALITERLK